MISFVRKMVPFCGDRKVVMLIIIVNTDDQTASLARSNNSNNSRRLFANSDPGNIGPERGSALLCAYMRDADAGMKDRKDGV